jgi:hypothetical protein
MLRNPASTMLDVRARSRVQSLLSQERLVNTARVVLAGDTYYHLQAYASKMVS